MMSLSSLRTARRFPAGLVGMIALIALCEGFIAAHDARFSRLEANDWKTSEQMARGSSGFSGVLCVGDSQIKFGMLPLVLESKIGQPVESHAVLGGQAPSTYFLLKKAIDSGARPSAIVIDWEPHLLKDGPDHNNRMWPELLDLSENLELSWIAGDSDGFLSRIVAGILPSFRARSEIRDNIKAALNGETPEMPDWIERSWRNKVMNRGATALAKDHIGRTADLGRWGNKVATPWSAHPVNTAFARKTLKLAQAYKIPVFLTIMPVSPGMQQKYEINGIDQPYVEWVKKLEHRFANVTVVDLRHSNYDASVFYDPLHLDRDGAVAASISLANYLRDHLDGQPIGERWVQMPSYRPSTEAVAFEDTTRTYQIMTRPGRVRR
jgi:hypothetical protein